MKTESDFIETIVRLMRLTHQGKLVWVKEEDSSSERQIPTYTAEINGLHLSLEDGLRRAELGDVDRRKVSDSVYGVDSDKFIILDSDAFNHPVYRLVVNDLSKDAEIISPPLHAADDLVAIIRGHDPDTLEEINRRLDAAL